MFIYALKVYHSSVLTVADLVIIIHSQPMYGTLKSKKHLRKLLTLLCHITTTNEEDIHGASKDL